MGLFRLVHSRQFTYKITFKKDAQNDLGQSKKGGDTDLGHFSS